MGGDDSSPFSVLKLIGTGITMGVIHVLTGPDHLSALATLSANVGNFKAFYLGAQWGMGHSVGLTVVAIILIALDDGSSGGDDEGHITVSSEIQLVLETFVGIFMLGLGVYGIYSVRRKYGARDDTIENDADCTRESNEVISVGIDTSATVEFLEKREAIDKGKDATELEMVERGGSGDQSHRAHQAVLELNELQNDFQNDCENGHGHDHDHTLIYSILDFLSCGKISERQKNDQDAETPRIVALFVGIVHGVAGPGGVLGVIPAVNLHSWPLAFVYLSSFCVTSIFVMGCFAASYGTFTTKFASRRNLEYQIGMFSAVLSIIVGVLWLTLISLGKLEDVFP
mmetsp:Transcript_12630/g.18963  ORF Transcript_12630/g.18963 Transcript_12630/m.18963 type:complete len:342 (+) Transcript_12630:169-1194(+)|eukprot:CAMPEP_0196809476 /NCGR_PEP_ID=MMETSP1362-20130617/9412_1 /TAXON_ID=163516 /ORGANISM="Leptocylindrus danicus, Strain CCMP1856" /LENGTH=341 /DNA_ID=CAMNT_0042184187 /DNA_START=149 /DNA_END=1174 /DNA_ORIENTATION=-